jgi:hypothetical protein
MMVSHLVVSDDRFQMTTIKGPLQYLEICMLTLTVYLGPKTNGSALGRRDILLISVLRLSGFYSVSKCFRFTRKAFFFIEKTYNGRFSNFNRSGATVP